jgi:hypothetical protein
MYCVDRVGASLLSLGVLLLLFGMVVVPEGKAQQDLPRWAESSSPSEERRQPKPSRRPAPDRAESAQKQTSPYDPPLQNDRGFRTRAEVCSPSACNGGQGCPEGQTCISPGKGNAPCQCKSNDSGVVQNTVPIGGAWAPFWTATMVVLAVGLGVYSLTRESQTGAPFVREGPDPSRPAT